MYDYQWCTWSSLYVEKYYHTAGMFYGYWGKLQYYPKTWKFVTDVDLEPKQVRMSQMKPLHVILNNICTEFCKENWC